MNIYIVGICGTFMGGLAKLAQACGHSIIGSDSNVYPPMSTQLESLGITLIDGFDQYNIQHFIQANKQPPNDCAVIIGNSISRGNPELEYILDNHLPFYSGAQWLAENILTKQWVLGVSGTHGKTTTASLLAWILEYNQLAPSFLIGGVCENFNASARLNNKSPFFVIEADEYDTAFSDKRSKFIHYRPNTLIINNLEFDHADIFRDLQAIQTQFHHLLKIMPQHGKVIYNHHSQVIEDTLKMGCWSETSSFGLQNSDWQVQSTSDSSSEFILTYHKKEYPVRSPLIGEHNMLNTIAAIAAAHHVGVPVENAIHALDSFKSVKRRLEIIYQDEHSVIYDDFAHHPTAIEETLKAVRLSNPEEKIIAILEPRSNTMKQGVHKNHIKNSLKSANHTFIYASHDIGWDVKQLESNDILVVDNTQTIIDQCLDKYLSPQKTDNQDKYHIIIMSNGGFESIHQRLIKQIHKQKI